MTLERKLVEMELLWMEIVKQAPSLGVLAWLVYTFLVAQDKRDQKLTELGNTCHDFQLRMAKSRVEEFEHVDEVIERNTAALTANTHALGRVESVLDDLDARIKLRT